MSSSHIWSSSMLRDEYAKYPVSTLRERLISILEWAEDNLCFKEARAKGPNFCITGKKREKLVTFQAGGAYWFFIIPEYFEGDNKEEQIEERDRMLEKLKTTGLLNDGLNNNTSINCRKDKKLHELDSKEFEVLLCTLCSYSYCSIEHFS